MSLDTFFTPEGVRQFILERGSGTADEVAAALGISRASYYRMVDLIVARLFLTNSEQHPNAKQSTPPWYVDDLVRFATKNPAWGCYRLAAVLSTERKVSGPTIQKALSKLGFAKREQRFEAAERALLPENGKDRPQVSEIPEHLIRQNPCTADLQFLQTSSGHIYAADVVILKSPSNSAPLFVLVTCLINTQECFLEAITSLDFAEAQEKGLKTALAWIDTHEKGGDQSELRFPVRNRLMTKFKSGVRKSVTVIATSKRQLPASLKVIANRVRRELGPDLERTNIGNGLAGVNNRLGDWANTYNNTPKAGFPTFGKSPSATRDSGGSIATK